MLVITIIITVAAILTPTPDILNMCLFAAPMDSKGERGAGSN
jgi:Sec-independent protein secretion pathway component TatC